MGIAVTFIALLLSKTFGQNKINSHDPVWSPDGSKLSFIRILMVILRFYTTSKILNRV